MKIIHLNVFDGRAKFHSDLNYLYALSLECVKADGTLGYASNLYLPYADEYRLFIAENGDEYDDIMFGKVKDMSWQEVELARMWDLCDHHGNKPSGRLEFNGYFEDYYDFEEREECVRDLTSEVENLWSKYVS